MQHKTHVKKYTLVSKQIKFKTNVIACNVKYIVFILRTLMFY